MTDRSRELERTTKHNAKGTFKLVNGVSQMNVLAHHPRNVVTGLQLRPHDVVPQQFSSTNAAMFAQ
jgi:hypothetical protein